MIGYIIRSPTPECQNLSADDFKSESSDTCIEKSLNYAFRLNGRLVRFCTLGSFPARNCFRVSHN